MMQFVAGIFVGIVLTIGGFSGLAAVMDSALDKTKQTIERSINESNKNTGL